MRLLFLIASLLLAAIISVYIGFAFSQSLHNLHAIDEAPSRLYFAGFEMAHRRLDEYSF